MADTKPIIRHCFNCQFNHCYGLTNDKNSCSVKYVHTNDGIGPRLRALLCKYYKKKGGVE